MNTIGYYLGISKQTEVLILTLIGIAYTIFDASLLDLNTNLHKVWASILDPTKFSTQSETYLKYLLSGIVLIRTLLVHIYLAFYIVMLWPLIFINDFMGSLFKEERPGLLLPWLIISAIKCLAMGAMSFATGSYICFVYGAYRPACLDFVLAQFIDHAPSYYMWCLVLSYYREINSYVVEKERQGSMNEDQEEELLMRRRKVRSLTNDFWPSHKMEVDEDRHLISVSTIENMVQHLENDLNRSNTRSLDSLLGKMMAEAEKEELLSTVDTLLSTDDESGQTIAEKAAKMLKISVDDIVKARDEIRKRSSIGVDEEVFLDSNIIENLAKRGYKLRPTKSERGCGCRVEITKIMDVIPENESCSVIFQNETVQPKGNTSSQELSSSVLETQPCNEEICQQETCLSNSQRCESHRDGKKTADCACQASTLSRLVLNATPSKLKMILGDPKLKKVIQNSRKDRRIFDNRQVRQEKKFDQ